MSEEMKILKDNTDRRFAILMTALQDFMVAYQQERNKTQTLLDIEEKVVSSETQAPRVQKRKKKS